jgi:hypothetical protein
MKYGLVAADDQRVAGIVPPLVADDGLRVIREPIDDLSFAFIAPLGADDYNVLGHFQSSFKVSMIHSEPRRLSTRSQPASRQEPSCPGNASITVSPRLRRRSTS